MYLSGEYGGYTPVARTLNITRINLINCVDRYSKLGEIGLKDGRGKRTTGQFILPPKLEGLPINEENLRLKVENTYLSSLLELNIDNIKKDILRNNWFVKKSVPFTNIIWGIGSETFQLLKVEKEQKHLNKKETGWYAHFWKN